MEGTLPCCLASSNAALVFVAGCDPCPPSRERIILRLERLEEIEAANNLLALISPSMPAGLVGPSSQTYAEPEIAAALSDSDSHPTITESTNPVLADKLFAESTASNEGARADDFASAGVLEEEQEISSSVSLFARQGEESNDLLKSIADDLLSARKNHSSEGGPTGQLGSPNLAGANAAPFGNPFGGSSTQTGSSGGSGNSSGGSGPGANGFSNAVLTAMTSQTALGTVAESNANSPQTSANQGMASPSTAALSVTQATPSTSGPQQSAIPTGVASSLSASSGSQAEAQSLLNNLPWMFEANVGQFDAQTQFMARGSAFDVALSATQVQFLLTSGSLASDPTDSAAAATSDAAPTTSVISMQLVGANPNAVASGVNELPTKTNYFAGDDPSQWRTNVANYASAQFRDV